MDNPAVPTPLISPQPTVPSPAKTADRRWLLWSAIGLTFLIFGIVVGIFGAKFLNQSQRPSPLTSIPSPTLSPIPTPTPDLTASWQVYTDTNLRFSFRHPNLDTNCCMIGGPFHGNATHIATFADKTTAREGTDKPFDGFAVYVDSSDKTSPEEYFNQEKSGISGYYKEAYGQTPPSTSFSRVTIGDNQAILFKYKPLSANYVLSLPDGGKLILTTTEETEGSFQSTFDQILSTFKFTDKSEIWQNYTSKNLGFSIDYPSGWRVVESGGAISAVGFGPKEIPEDVLWGVTIYDKSQTSKEKVINETGNQFSDRKQTSEIVNLNGIQATKLATTTLSHTDWYLETIIVETNTKIYAISNGAISDTTLGSTKGVPNGVAFENFYSTFKFTD